MENHHFYWENSLFLWLFSIAMLNYQRVTGLSSFSRCGDERRCSADGSDLVRVRRFEDETETSFTGRNQQKGKKPSIFHGRLLCFFASPDWMLVRKKIKE